jgi:cytidylate kinase
MSPSPVIITMDGPAGVGKSTLARRVAESLGVAYLDTGAMFRTVALHIAKSRGAASPPDDPTEAPVEGPELQTLLKQCVFSLQGSGDKTRLLCNGRAVGDEIRSEEAGMMAARIAKVGQVREFLKQAQQRLGNLFSLVAEGRDMGTVVFPHAVCKIFLDASPEIRAERRYRQLLDMGEQADLAELTQQIRDRDHEDRNRTLAPLKPAGDAAIIDTSHKDISEVFSLIIQRIQTMKNDTPPSPPLRRKDRMLEDEKGMALLERGEYGMLALCGDGEAGAWPYAVPLSYILMDGVVYFHCAKEGRKTDMLARNNRVCFTVVSDTQPVYSKGFSTYYESVMVFGHVSPVEDEEEKYRALFRLAEKYLPDHMDKADGDIRHSFSRTAVFRISLERVTAKGKPRAM